MTKSVFSQQRPGVLLQIENMGIKAEQIKVSIRSIKAQCSDEMLFEDYRNLAVSYNAESAGLSRIGVAGFAAFFRSHLAELLLIEPVKLLFIRGINTTDMMPDYIKSKLDEKGKIL